MAKKLYAGVDLGGTSMVAVIADSRGEILGSSDAATQLGDASITIDQIAEMVKLAANEAGVKFSKVRALGIGAPGAVEPKTGVVVRAPNLGWTDVALGPMLEERLGCDVVLGNDVQVAIVGEHAFGAARKADRAIGIWVGTGIGGGLIIDGKLYRGSRGAAGEIGHMALSDDGPACPCGRKGCAEAYASRTSMERDVMAACKNGRQSVVPQLMTDRGKTRMTSSTIARALKADDAVMKEVLGRAQHYLGVLAGNLVNAFDPEVVVIGGGIAQRLKEDFVAPIRDTARARFLKPDTDDRVKITHATLGDFSGALGACALARDE